MYSYLQITFTNIYFLKLKKKRLRCFLARVVSRVSKIPAAKTHAMGCGSFVTIIYTNKYHATVASIKISVSEKSFSFNSKLKYAGFLRFGTLNSVRQLQKQYFSRQWRLSLSLNELIGFQKTCFSLLSCNLFKASFESKFWTV